MDDTVLFEVSLTDKTGFEHIYWVEMKNGQDEDDAIVRAISFHSTTDLPAPFRLPNEEDEDWDSEPAIIAYDPFDRDEDEYVLVPLAWGYQGG